MTTMMAGFRKPPAPATPRHTYTPLRHVGHTYSKAAADDPPPFLRSPSQKPPGPGTGHGDSVVAMTTKTAATALTKRFFCFAFSPPRLAHSLVFPLHINLVFHARAEIPRFHLHNQHVLIPTPARFRKALFFVSVINFFLLGPFWERSVPLFAATGITQRGSDNSNEKKLKRTRTQ